MGLFHAPYVRRFSNGLDVASSTPSPAPPWFPLLSGEGGHLAGAGRSRRRSVPHDRCSRCFECVGAVQVIVDPDDPPSFKVYTMHGWRRRASRSLGNMRVALGASQMGHSAPFPMPQDTATSATRLAAQREMIAAGRLFAHPVGTVATPPH